MKKQKGDCLTQKEFSYRWENPLGKLKERGFINVYEVCSALIDKHLDDMNSMLALHYEGEAVYKNEQFKITLKNPVLRCEIENLIYTGSRFNYYGKEIEMNPVLLDEANSG
jgi:hypothetical protein